jgi:hypothetical protein
MSTGTRFYNWREGDRSEYLAVYLLSALGLVTQVPRQEDIGFDLICDLAEQDSGILSFHHHYAVSVKSASTPRAVLAPPESKKEDPTYCKHFDWLFNLELPLMLAVVDKEKQELALYSTLPAWFLFHETLHECGIIELVPRIDDDGNNPNVYRPKDCGTDPEAGGKRRFEVDLGFPITKLTVDDLKNKELLKQKKESLCKAIELGTESARFAQSGTPYFWWFNVTIPGGYVAKKTNPDGYNGGVAWFVGACRNTNQLNQMMRGLAPRLMSAALLFKKADRLDLLTSLRDAIRLLPADSVPLEIKNELPEIFSDQPTQLANPEELLNR